MLVDVWTKSKIQHQHKNIQHQHIHTFIHSMYIHTYTMFGRFFKYSSKLKENKKRQKQIYYLYVYINGEWMTSSANYICCPWFLKLMFMTVLSLIHFQGWNWKIKLFNSIQYSVCFDQKCINVSFFVLYIVERGVSQHSIYTCNNIRQYRHNILHVMYDVTCLNNSLLSLSSHQLQTLHSTTHIYTHTPLWLHD